MSTNDPLEIEAEWLDFVKGLAAGDANAFETFWSLYGKRLDLVAKKHFPQSLNRRLAPEDIVQSTCRSFFARVTDGRIAVSDRESLWGLLCAIVLNKTRMKQRFHLAKRRTLHRENEPCVDGDFDRASSEEPTATQQTAEDAVMFSEQLAKIMELLDPTERQILQLKLDHFTNDEISLQVNRSERTVRRIIQRLQEKLSSALPNSIRPAREDDTVA